MADGDKPIRSRTGATHDGQPLSFGRVPGADLRPWITRTSVTEVIVPRGQAIDCRMLNDYAVLRVIFGAPWTAQTADGPFECDPGAKGATLYFGPHSRAMPITVHGSFKILSLNLAVGASTVLGGPEPAAFVNRIVDFDEWLGHGKLSSRFDRRASPTEWLDTLDREFRTLLARNAPEPPDRLSAAFQAASLTDPNIPVARFAEQHGVATRTLERTVRRDFGMTPKQVLRRARALDMTAILLGVARSEEEAGLRLRYADESHLIREMRHFFGMTPGQLRSGDHPLLRITVEIRQQRRLEALELLGQGGLMPWRDPDAEPGAG